MTRPKNTPRVCMTFPLAPMLGAVLVCVACVACAGGGVKHPEGGGKGTVQYCADAPAEEQNCMACSAKPGCGYCGATSGGAPLCQPGIPGDDTPSTCGSALVTNSTQCPSPPPPVD